MSCTSTHMCHLAYKSSLSLCFLPACSAVLSDDVACLWPSKALVRFHAFACPVIETTAYSVCRATSPTSVKLLVARAVAFMRAKACFAGRMYIW